MSWLIYLFGSGWAFFLGVALVLVAVALLPRVRGGWRGKMISLLAFAGLVVIGFSAAPLSYWWYGAAGLLTCAWLLAERRETAATKAAAATVFTRNIRWATVAILVGGVLLELPFQFGPRLPALGRPPLYIVGDSMTAGTGAGDKERWPELLPESIEVHDMSRIGATTSSALLNQCDRLPSEGGLLVLEIGGNDLLGDTPASQFRRDLNQLLSQVAAPGRTIVMFELPLPPLGNEYGRIQRQLAARHRAHLIPKRIFMSVLAGDDSTLDSIHLSPSGHERMAAAVWSIIQPAYRGPGAPAGQ